MEINNIFTHLVQEFCKEHIGSVIFIIIMSVSLGLIQTNGISEFTALLIDQIEGNTNTFVIFYQSSKLYYSFPSKKGRIFYKTEPEV